MAAVCFASTSAVSQTRTIWTGTVPIIIDSDSDFNSSHGVRSGDGSIDTPFEIRDWTIYATGKQYGIKIVGIDDKYFTIKNVSIYYQEDDPAAGAAIYLYDNGSNLTFTITGATWQRSMTSIAS